MPSLLAFAFVVLLQITQPSTFPPITTDPNPQPQPVPVTQSNSPGAGGPSSSHPAAGASVQVLTKEQFGDYMVSGVDALATAVDNGALAAMHSTFGPPSWLTSRNRDNTLDNEQSSQMGDTLRWYMLG